MSDKKFTDEQQKLIDFTMGELKNILGDLQKGKIPKMSNKMANLQEQFSKVSASTTEEEMNELVKDVVEKIGK